MIQGIGISGGENGQVPRLPFSPAGRNSGMMPTQEKGILRIGLKAMEGEIQVLQQARYAFITPVSIRQIPVGSCLCKAYIRNIMDCQGEKARYVSSLP